MTLTIGPNCLGQEWAYIGQARLESLFFEIFDLRAESRITVSLWVKRLASLVLADMCPKVWGQVIYCKRIMKLFLERSSEERWRVSWRLSQPWLQLLLKPVIAFLFNYFRRFLPILPIYSHFALVCWGFVTYAKLNLTQLLFIALCSDYLQYLTEVDWNSVFLEKYNIQYPWSSEWAWAWSWKLWKLVYQ